jgi:hypothetical protein
MSKNSDKKDEDHIKKYVYVNNIKYERIGLFIVFVVFIGYFLIQQEMLVFDPFKTKKYMDPKDSNLFNLMENNVKNNENIQTLHEINEKTKIQYMTDEEIFKMIHEFDVLKTMVGYLASHNNTYLISLPEIYSKYGYSFLIASMWKIKRKSCSGLKNWLFGCKDYYIRYPYELIFNPCIIGESMENTVDVEYVRNPYNSFGRKRTKKKKSIKVRYKRPVFFENELYLDEVCDWWSHEAGIELQIKIKQYTSDNNNYKCFFETKKK